MIKRVLLIGEYSGFYINLKKGLESLGISCTLAANGDDWKKIEGADFELYKDVEKPRYKKLFYKVISPFIFCKKLYGYDVVQFIDPKIYHPYINGILFKKIKRHNDKVFVNVAGHSYSLYEAYKLGKLGYYVFDDNPILCDRYEGKHRFSALESRQEKYIYDNVDGIIPIMHEYALAVNELSNCKKTIPLPFDTSSIEYSPNIVSDKIVILHGIIRPEDKGTPHILEALDIIKKKYPNDVEIIVDGNMPLNDYLKLLKRANILIDQCKEHCYGMNALYAMAMGKIVLGGASKDSLLEFGISESPIIHIEPNAKMIANNLEKLISMKSNFEIMGEKSRDFVCKIHDSKNIAKQYLEVWDE